MRTCNFLLILSCILICHLSAYSQVNRDSCWAHMVVMLQKGMALSPQVTAKLIEIGGKQNRRLDSLNARKSLTVDERGRELNRIRQAFFDRMRSILTPSQWQEYRQMLEDRKSSYLVDRKDKKIQLRELDQN